MQQPVHIAGWIISEPVTLLTNSVICATSIYCSRKVFLGNKKDIVFIRNFGFFLFFTGIAAFWGGIFSHGFKSYFSINYSIPGWVLALIGSYFAVRGALHHAHHFHIHPFHTQKLIDRFLFLNLLFLFVAIVVISIYSRFYIVAIYSAITLTFFCGMIEWHIYRQTKDRGSLWYLGGVLAGILTLLLFIFEVRIDPFLDTNDISHLWMIVGIILFSKSFDLMDTKDEAYD
ncbi:MAG: hypothetical protein J5I59_05845 [Saprospiraceae bacterium]|nr:hypothetical protein [Saprospiraceae bacterium]